MDRAVNDICKGDIMGKIIDKKTGETLATFESEKDGMKLEQEYKGAGKKIKIEW